MNNIYFKLDTRRRTPLEGIARALIAVVTLLLFLPCLLIAILLTIVISLIPLGVLSYILIPFDLIWRGLLWALLRSSETWENQPLLRLPLFVVGIPLAIISYVFIGCFPSLSYDNAKESRLALCDQWPLTWSLWRQLDNKVYAKAEVRSFLPQFHLSSNY